MQCVAAPAHAGLFGLSRGNGDERNHDHPPSGSAGTGGAQGEPAKPGDCDRS